MKNTNATKWQKELKSFLGIKSGVILEGNTLDEFLYEREGKNYFRSLDLLIHEYAMEVGAEVVYYNPLHGFYCYADVDEMQILKPYLLEYEYKCTSNIAPGNQNAYMPTQKKTTSNENEKCADSSDENDSLKQVYMSEIVLKAMLNEETRTNVETGETLPKTAYPSKIIVLNFASRLEQCNLDKPAETEMFMNLHYAINNSRTTRGGKKNMIIMIVDKYNDVPAWLYHNNPNMRTFYIESPDRKTRRLYMPIAVAPTDYERYRELGKTNSDISENFVAETGDLLCTEIKQVIALASNEDIGVDEMDKAIKMYKYGLKESPWEELEDNIVERMNENLQKRVKGQDLALGKVKQVIMRAVKGLSGLQHSNAGNKPRGVLFFAGPTGVGKTETAKTIAETIFGDEDACIRFDMSEYRLEHSDQKLFGAPPGYVGYDGGGQLTNAVKNHPFSVLLFDEIEKAHPSILDKFLQILEDGRMTDNQGNTVYFSESIIIFTSNIGMTELVSDEYGKPVYDERGNIKRQATIKIDKPFEDDSDEFKEKTIRVITNGVKDYFVNIGRPELLNRLGENNIVVFNFIDKNAATLICEHQISNIVKTIEQKLNIQVDTAGIVEYLNAEAIAQRENGGRGIGNMLEEKLLNPISEFICEYTGILSKIVCFEEAKNIVFRGE